MNLPVSLYFCHVSHASNTESVVLKIVGKLDIINTKYRLQQPTMYATFDLAKNIRNRENMKAMSSQSAVLPFKNDSYLSIQCSCDRFGYTCFTNSRWTVEAKDFSLSGPLQLTNCNKFLKRYAINNCFWK